MDSQVKLSFGERFTIAVVGVVLLTVGIGCFSAAIVIIDNILKALPW